MTSLFLFEKLNESQKKLTLFSLGIFLIANSILIIFYNYYIFYGILLSGGTNLSIISLLIFKNARMRRIYKTLIFDQFLYVFIFIFILLILENFTIQERPIFGGLVFRRIEYDKFSFFMLFILISIIGPSIHDPTVTPGSQLRGPDYYQNVPFSNRRTLATLPVFPIFWVLGLMALSNTTNPYLILFEIFLCVILTILCFERIYGYNSYILRLFGGGLGFYIMISIAFEYKEIIFFLKNQKLFAAVIAPLLAASIYAPIHAINRLIGMQSGDRIIQEQKITRKLMILILSLGCFFTVLYWMIFPIYSVFGPELLKSLIPK